MQAGALKFNAPACLFSISYHFPYPQVNSEVFGKRAAGIDIGRGKAFVHHREDHLPAVGLCFYGKVEKCVKGRLAVARMANGVVAPCRGGVERHRNDIHPARKERGHVPFRNEICLTVCVESYHRFGAVIFYRLNAF